MKSRIAVFGLALGLAACAAKKTEVAAAGGIAGVESPPGTFLAYEHHVAIELAPARIAERAVAAQQACIDRRFGGCAVLISEQRSGEWPGATLTVRIAPSGVEPLLALASEGGDVTTRSTKAEDLAQAVADNAAERARLEKLQARLAEFAARKDLKVEDALTLSREMAQAEVRLEEIARDAAQQKRRIETNLLSISMTPPGESTASRSLVSALEDAGASFLDGAAAVVEIGSFLAPFGLAGAALFVGVRWAWRRHARSERSPS